MKSIYVIHIIILYVRERARVCDEFFVPTFEVIDTSLDVSLFCAIGFQFIIHRLTYATLCV